MKIHLDADYNTQRVFYPVYRFNGHLTAIEVKTCFSHLSANVVIPQDILLPQLSAVQRLRLLQDEIECIKKNHEFFCQQDVAIVMSIDAQVADILKGNEMLVSKLKALPCLQLELDEAFPGLSQGISNPLLAFLHENFSLNLRNYGAGKASSKAVFDGLFTRIKIDKGFIQQTMNRNVSPSFINTVFYHIRPYCQQVILPGVDDIEMFRQAYHFDVDGIMGNLFMSVNEATLGKLTQLPEVFLQLAR